MNKIFEDLKKNIKHGKFVNFDKYEEWFISELTKIKYTLIIIWFENKY